MANAANRHTVALCAVLLLAFALRAWGIGWGMPYAFHPDEDNYLPGAISMMMRGDLNPHYFRNPPLLTYLVTLELSGYLLLERLLGLMQSASDLKRLLHFDSPTPLYVLARANSALLGSATVYLTYMAARSLRDVRAGLLGAAILAVSFLHVRDSHYAVNDVPATFFLIASFCFAVRVFKMGRIPDYLLGGILLGLAAATKYNAALGGVTILMAHLLRYRKGGAYLHIQTHVPLVGAGLASIAAFVIANPYAVLDWPAFLQGVAEQYGWTADPFRTMDASQPLVIARTLWEGVGAAALVASVLGLALLLVRRPAAAVLLASFPLIYLAFFLLGSDLFYARFAIPLLPFIAILAAEGALGLVSLLRSGRIRVAVVAVAIAILILPPALTDVRHNALLRAEDTRLLLGRWIEENVPPESKIAVEGYSFLDTQGQPIGPKKIHYTMEVLPTISRHSLDYYHREGFDYLLTSSFTYGRYFNSPQAHPEPVRFYQQLEEELEPVASFRPGFDNQDIPFMMDEEVTPFYSVFERERPGPTLDVYQIGHPRSYGACWLDSSIPREMSAGQLASVVATVENSGEISWPNQGYTPVRIAYRWVDSRGAVGLPEGRADLPREVMPGDRVSVRLEVTAPESPGDYLLELDLVQENFAWLSSRGVQTERTQVTVNPSQAANPPSSRFACSGHAS